MPAVKCDLCDNPAAVHVTDVEGDSCAQRHLCHEHAGQQFGLSLSPFSLTQLDGAAFARLCAALGQGESASDPAQWCLSDRAVPALLGLLQDEHPCLRYHAAEWLGQIGPKSQEAVAALKRAAEDADPHVRRAVGDALTRIAD